MRFTLNLATGTVLDQRQVHRVFVLLGILLPAFLVWNVLCFANNLGELRRLTVDIAALQSRVKTPGTKVSEGDRAVQRAEIGFFNDIISRRTFGWLDLLEQLETTVPDGIRLSALTPDKKSGMVRIEGLARNFGKVRTYLEMLEDSGRCTDVQLVSHENKTLWEQASGVRFSVTFRVRTS